MKVEKIEKIIVFNNGDQFHVGESVIVKGFGKPAVYAVIESVSEDLGENCSIGFITEEKEWFPLYAKDIEKIEHA